MTSRDRLGRRVPGSGRAQMGARSRLSFRGVRPRLGPRSRGLVISSYSVPRSRARSIRMSYEHTVQYTTKSSNPRPSGGVRVEGLGKRFGEQWALRDVDLDAPAGTVLGLLGHNGAGKTTAIRILTTLSRPTTGHASVAGH